ncbi:MULTISPECIES: hypothetical protein [unclassified Geobacillus]|uniref:hypothetical protein n=1 Tax=unclassified Geobacillus TaxID=2642459 RepID=UPI000BE3A871|nr:MULTISPECIES: hypothetical protein [unclassified Geobacillus]PDM39130.1 hypothetical protein CN643_00375 [Parageobacillus yumthangensis]RDV23759.1 hypothetical protein DXK91_00670 [Parageobacillus toebii]TXK90321.1 hypothetical protein FVE24_12250 [Parageobacillus sp. SY1]PUF87703.1 hypothetical protein DCC82_00380 [Geobacillus sp. LYN3]TXK86227.1 hypothetical protein FVE68_15635 [Geobacillus sp. AYS3]
MVIIGIGFQRLKIVSFLSKILKLVYFIVGLVLSEKRDDLAQKKADEKMKRIDVVSQRLSLVYLSAMPL